MKRNFVAIAIVVLALLFAGCTQYVYWPIYDNDNSSESAVVESAVTEGVYVIGEDDFLPVAVEYSDGSVKTLMVPADVIKSAAGAVTGIQTLNLTYDGVSFTVEIYVPAEGGIETDSNYINSVDKLKELLADNNSEERVAVLACDISIDSAGDIPFINNACNLHIYSTDPDNTLTVNGLVSSEAAFYFNTGSNIKLEGFTIKDGNTATESPKPLFKAHGITGLVLENMRFETNERGLDLNGNTNVEIINCTITKTSRAFGELQIRNASDITVNGLTIEDKEGTNNIGTIVFNYPSTGDEPVCTDVIFSNLSGVDLIYGPTSTGIAVNSNELTDYSEQVSGYNLFLYATVDGYKYMEEALKG